MSVELTLYIGATSAMNRIIEGESRLYFDEIARIWLGYQREDNQVNKLFDRNSTKPLVYLYIDGDNADTEDKYGTQLRAYDPAEVIEMLKADVKSRKASQHCPAAIALIQGILKRSFADERIVVVPYWH